MPMAAEWTWARTDPPTIPNRRTVAQEPSASLCGDRSRRDTARTFLHPANGGIDRNVTEIVTSIALTHASCALKADWPTGCRGSGPDGEVASNVLVGGCRGKRVEGELSLEMSARLGTRSSRHTLSQPRPYYHRLSLRAGRRRRGHHAKQNRQGDGVFPHLC